MTAETISGKIISAEIREEVARETADLSEKYGITPGLATVLVGEDEASRVYVSNKEKTCKKIGIYSEGYHLREETSEDELLKLIDRLNKKKNINGILVQLPLPRQINESRILYKIDPRKDVDGFHPVNLGKLIIGHPDFLPCTPAGIQQLLMRSNVKIEGANVVIVGRSNIVGKPLANILFQKAKNANATVTICHTRTQDIASHTRRADILIVAAGRPKFITADMVKKKAVVIDVGVNRLPEGLCGDVDFEAVKEVASKITPVPGGVGPMTITMLMKNTVRAAKLQAGIE